MNLQKAADEGLDVCMEFMRSIGVTETRQALDRLLRPSGDHGAEAAIFSSIQKMHERYQPYESDDFHVVYFLEAMVKIALAWLKALNAPN